MDIRWRHFVWDAGKAKSNLNKHHVSFKEAAWSTYDPRAIQGDGDNHSIEEIRQWLLGESPKKRVLLVVFTKREDELTRIISARRATQEEQELYETEN